MDGYASSASNRMTLDDMDPSVLEEMRRQIQLEQLMGQGNSAESHYDTANFDPTLSPLSGYASPSSMTTGSTNQSPSVPLLDYEMSYSMASFSEDPENFFPELVGHPINMESDWLGSLPEGYGGPYPTSNDDEPKVASQYPLYSQLYPTAAPGTTTYNSVPALSPCLTTIPPPTTAHLSPSVPTPSSSSSQTTHTTNLICSHCGARFTDKTKLKVHTNKHTKPFRCTVAGCGYKAAEKKSLERHMLAQAKRNEEHRAAARSGGVRQVRHSCPGKGCTYVTDREDNLKRHMNTCAQ